MCCVAKRYFCACAMAIPAACCARRTASSHATSSCHCDFDRRRSHQRRSTARSFREGFHVRLIELRLENLRNISSLAVELDPGINLFIGPNGAGKTSILEGAYLLSHAQSFRGGQASTLIRRGAAQLNLFARVERQAGPVQIGLSRTADRWSAKVNNDDSVSLGRV